MRARCYIVESAHGHPSRVALCGILPTSGGYGRAFPCGQRPEFSNFCIVVLHFRVLV
jgi:hypothetical protein